MTTTCKLEQRLRLPDGVDVGFFEARVYWWIRRRGGKYSAASDKGSRVWKGLELTQLLHSPETAVDLGIRDV